MSDDQLSVGEQENLDPQTTQTEPAEQELTEEEQAKEKLKQAIIVDRTQIGALRERLSVTIPRETLDERMNDQFAELKRDALVPGFRKGHAPLRLVEKRFASDVGEQLSSELVGEAYLAAVEKEGLKPLGDPLFCVTVRERRPEPDEHERAVEVERLLNFEKALDHLKLPKEGAFTFSCEVELKPEFELPKLEKISLERPAVLIEEDDVDTELARICSSRGRYWPVEGGIEAGDLLYADVTMKVDEAVVQRDENVEVSTRDPLVNGVKLVGMGDAIVGKKVGDEVGIEAAVPDDHENISIRGKTAVIDIAIREAKRFVMQPLDEPFLTWLGFESEDELRTSVREKLQHRLEASAKAKMREMVGKYLVENTSLEIPEGLSQRQMERSLARRRLMLLRMGMSEAKVDEVIARDRDSAQERVIFDLKLFFILEKIADERNVTVSEERLNSAIAEIAQEANKRFDRVRDELSKGDGLMTLYLQLREEQVLDALIADAEITEAPPPPKKKSRKKLQ